jgi:hypothetical protein
VYQRLGTLGARGELERHRTVHHLDHLGRFKGLERRVCDLLDFRVHRQRFRGQGLGFRV